MNTDSTEIVHWSLCRVAVNTNPRLEMLSGSVVLPIRCRLMSESPRNKPAVLRYVSFDRSFIEYKLRLAVRNLDTDNLTEKNKALLKQMFDVVLEGKYFDEIQPDYGDIFDDQL